MQFPTDSLNPLYGQLTWIHFGMNCALLSFSSFGLQIKSRCSPLPVRRLYASVLLGLPFSYQLRKPLDIFLGAVAR